MTRPLTVVQVVPALEAGGVERGTLEVGRALVAAGHRSLVISGGGAMVATLEHQGSRHLSWPVGRKSPWSLRWVPRLRRLFREQGVDIVHARSRLPAWLCWLAWRGMPAARRPRFVTTLHGLHSVNAYSAIMGRGERVICVSETARRYLLDNYPGVSAERLTVIPRGVDRDEWPAHHRPDSDWLERWREDPGAPPPGRRLLVLPGRLTRRKGHEAFVELLARLVAEGRDVHGLVVGPVPSDRQRYRAELERLAADRGVADRLAFTGARDDIRDIYAVADLVLSLSDKPEAFGRTVLEALSLGRPVLGWDHGGVGEQLHALYPAGAVAHGDLDALVRRAAALLDDPPAVPEEHPYTREAMLEATLALYAELAAD